MTKTGEIVRQIVAAFSNLSVGHNIGNLIELQ